MGSQAMGLHGPAPHGRGRALAPPPGLQRQSHDSNRHRAPGGLSQFWTPGPTIPEDDEDREPELSELNLAAWLPPLELPRSMDYAGSFYGSDASPGYCPWSKTPSPPLSPASATRRHARGVGLSVASTPVEAVTGSPQVGAAYIPMYVTVPLALANCCPHCGNHFAVSAASTQTHHIGQAS